MTDARWLDIDDDLEGAIRHFQMAVRIFDDGAFDDPGFKGYRDTMAFMHSMQSAHTSAEAAFVRLLAILDEALPSGPDWHEALIRRLTRPVSGDYARPALLSDALQSLN